MPYFPPSGGGGGSGTVTNVATGAGLSGGPITTTGTLAIDSTVATLTGSQTLTNKTIGGATLTGALTSATSPTLSSSAADGATAVGVILDHANAFSTQAARDVSFRSAGVEYFNTWDDGTNVNLNVPVNKVLKISQRVTMSDGTVVGSNITMSTFSTDINPGANYSTTQYRFTQTAFWPQNATKSLGDTTHMWQEMWAKILGGSDYAALTISGNAITLTSSFCSIGTGLLKTINPPTPLDSGTFAGFVVIKPTGAFTYDNTGNIDVAVGGGLAVVDRLMIGYYSGGRWTLSY